MIICREDEISPPLWATNIFMPGPLTDKGRALFAAAKSDHLLIVGIHIAGTRGGRCCGTANGACFPAAQGTAPSGREWGFERWVTGAGSGVSYQVRCAVD